jgi:hypothetical protein
MPIFLQQDHENLLTTTKTIKIPTPTIAFS